jgi:hypothetical protein
MRQTLIVVALLFVAQLTAGYEGLMYYPVDQCRVIDTRVKTAVWCVDFDWSGEFEDDECLNGIPAGGILAFVLAGDSSRVVVKGRGYPGVYDTHIGDQGAAPDGCEIPLDAKVVSMMMAVIPVWDDAPGHVKVWPYGVHAYLWGGIPQLNPEPGTSHINFSPNETAESTWFLQQICDPETANFGDCNEDIAIKPTGSPVHVVIDVNGYFK